MRKCLFLALMLCLSSTALANEPDTSDYADLYKEFFGIELEEERLTTNVKVFVNGNEKKEITIEYLSVSQELNLSSKEFIELIDSDVMPSKKAELFTNFQSEDLDSQTLEKLDFKTEFSLSKKTLKITLPMNYSKEYVINLNESKQKRRFEVPGKVNEAEWFSNYTNVSFQNSFDYDENQETINQWSYDGVARFDDDILVYGGEFGDYNRLHNITYKRKVPFMSGSMALGTNTFDIDTAHSYLDENFSNYYLGFSYRNLQSRYKKTIKDRSIPFELTEEGEVRVYVNNFNVYKKKHRPGKYRLKNFKLRTGKNDVLVIIETSELLTIEKTMYHIYGLSPKKFDLEFGSGLLYSTSDYLQGISYSAENLYSNVNLRLGLANFATSKIETMISKEHLTQSYSVDMAVRPGLSSTTITKEYSATANKSVMIIDQQMKWRLPNFLKALKMTSMKSSVYHQPAISQSTGDVDARQAFSQSMNFKGAGWSSTVGINKSDEETNLSLGYSDRLFGAKFSSSLTYGLNVDSIDLGLSIEKKLLYNLDLSTRFDYDSTDSSESWTLQVLGKYKFNYLGNDISPILGMTSESSSGETSHSLEYGVSHKYNSYYDDSEIGMATSILPGNSSARISIADKDKRLYYQLSEEDDAFSQSFSFSNSLIKTSIIENDNVLRTGFSTAFGFTKNQFGVAKSIDDSFALYKVDPDLPRGTTIMAKSKNIGRFSAVGNGPSKRSKDYDSISYATITVEGQEHWSLEKFKVKYKPYAAYEFLVKNENVFEFSVQLIDSKTKEPVEVLDYVYIYRENSEDEAIVKFLIDGRVTVSQVPSDRYVISIPGYKPAYVDISGRKIEDIKRIDLGQIKVKARD